MINLLKENHSPKAHHKTNSKLETLLTQEKEKEKEKNIETRLVLMENNISKLNLQTDSLLPLLSHVPEIIIQTSQFSKIDNLTKMLVKKTDDFELRISKFEKIIDKKPENKNVFKYADDQLKDLENKLVYQFKQHETKYKEDINNIQKQIDQKIDKLRQEFDKNHHSILNSSSNYRNKTQLDEKYLLSIVQEVERKSLAEIKNIYKEIGGLKCDAEYLNQRQFKQQIQEKLQSIPNEVHGVQKSFLANTIELEKIVADLQNYEHENTFRLNLEIISISDVAEKCLNQSKKEKENELVIDRIISFKYQLQATKKKFFIEMNKIDIKFEFLHGLMQQLQQIHNLHTAVNQQLNNIPIIEHKLSVLANQININIENLFQKVHQLENNLS